LSSSIKSKLFVVGLVLCISGCTATREEYISEYKSPITNKVKDSIVVRTSGGVVNSGSQSTMMSAGNNVFINVSTGKKGPSFALAEREAYGVQLAELLRGFKAYESVKYIHEDERADSAEAILDVKFDKTYVGGDGWPTELDVTISIIKNGRKLFSKNYKSSSGALGGGCWSCFPADVASKKLNEKFFVDLNEFLSKNKT